MVLVSNGIVIDDDDATHKYVGQIVTRLPSEIFDLVPEKLRLKSCLEFIEKIDKSKADTTAILNAPQVHLRPSHQLALLKDEMTRSMPDADTKTIYKLAWQSIVSKLNQSLRTQIRFLNIKDFPDEDQLENIDTIWEDLPNNVYNVNTTPNQNEIGTKTNDKVMAINSNEELLNRIRKLEATIQENKTAYTNVQQRPFVNGNTGAVTQYRPLSEQPHVNGTCIYHQRFGTTARRCSPPCNMAVRNQALSNQQTNVQLNSTPNRFPNYPNTPLRNFRQPQTANNVSRNNSYQQAPNRYVNQQQTGFNRNTTKYQGNDWRAPSPY
jgi:hypothetical protein